MPKGTNPFKNLFNKLYMTMIVVRLVKDSF